MPNSRKMARTLVALNVPAAGGARDEALFDCLEDDTKTPPEDLVFSDSGGPITIIVFG